MAWPSLGNLGQSWQDYRRGGINGSPLAALRPNTQPYASPYENAFLKHPQAGQQHASHQDQHALVKYPQAGVPQNPAFASATQGATGGGQLASPLRAGLATSPGSLKDAIQIYEQMALAARPGYTYEDDLARAQETPEERLHQIWMDSYVQPGESAAMDAEIAQMRADWDANEEAIKAGFDAPLGSAGAALDPQYRYNQALQANQGLVTASRNADAWRKPEDRRYAYLGSDGSVQQMEPLAERQPTPYMQQKQFDLERMWNGTWQYGPMVGTQGLPPLPTREEREAEWDRKIAELKRQSAPFKERLRQRAIARALGDPDGMTRYHPLYNPEGRIVRSAHYNEDGSPQYIDRKSGLPVYMTSKERDAAMRRWIKHGVDSKARRRQKYNAARAAGYARHHGIPMGTAQGIIGAMDRQRADSPLSSDDRALLGMPDIERQIAEQRYLADRQNVAAILGHYLGNESASNLTPEQVMQILQGTGFASPLGPDKPSGAAANPEKPGLFRSLFRSRPKPAGMPDDVLNRLRKEAAAGNKKAAEAVAAEEALRKRIAGETVFDLLKDSPEDKKKYGEIPAYSTGSPFFRM